MPAFTRRMFLHLTGAGALGLASRFDRTRHRPRRLSASEMLLYVGTYTSGDSKGIYVCRMDSETGAVTLSRVIEGVANPSFLAVDGGQRYLYAVNETMEFGGEPGGAVSAYAIDRKSGDLALLNQQPSHGGAPCHVAVDSGNRYVLVANYMGGNASVFPVLDDGRLGEAVDVVQHSGSGPNPDRQDAPHAHSVTLDPSNRFVYVADLGIDKVMSYRLDPETGKLAANSPPWAAVKPGAGPRHFAFHPNGRHAYVINELDSSVTAFAFDAASGSLTEQQTLPTLPADFSGANSCADIHVHPSGRFLYGSNRGHDSIAGYEIDENGALSLMQHQSTLGQTPRNFAIDPTGRFLLAANQRSDTIVGFAIDVETGTLTPTGQVAEIPTPVCLRFVLPHA